MKAPASSQPPLQGHQVFWHMDVAHLHSDGRKRIDTRITLWRPIDGGRDWVIEKRLHELDGSTLARLSVANEKQMIGYLMERGLPCAAQLDARASGRWLGMDDPYAVYTRYAGASVEELFRHPLCRFEHAQLLAAMLEAAARYARAGVMLYDFSVRNAGVPLSRITEGKLLFDDLALFDHSHSVHSGGAGERPFPFIGIPSAACPELAALLRQDQRRSLREQVPDCPVDSLEALGALPAPQRQHWMQRLKSPAAGGALDRGELNIEAALQSLLGWNLLELLRSHPALPSQRLHESAVSFLRQARPLLERMNAADPAERFASLHEAAAAWRALGGLRPTQLSDVKLVPPSGGPIDGASQPQTAPPERETLPPDAPTLAGDRGTGSTPPAWSHWRASGGRGDGASPGAAPGTVARAKSRLDSLHAGWQRQSRGHRAAIFLGCTVLLAIPGLGGWVHAPTARSLAWQQERVQLAQLARNLTQAVQRDERGQALRQLLRIAADGAAPASQQAKRLLQSEWKQLSRLLSTDLLGRPLQGAAVRQKALAEVQLWADHGHPEAQALVR